MHIRDIRCSGGRHLTLIIVLTWVVIAAGFLPRSISPVVQSSRTVSVYMRTNGSNLLSETQSQDSAITGPMPPGSSYHFRAGRYKYRGKFWCNFRKCIGDSILIGCEYGRASEYIGSGEVNPTLNQLLQSTASPGAHYLHRRFHFPRWQLHPIQAVEQ